MLGPYKARTRPLQDHHKDHSTTTRSRAHTLHRYFTNAIFRVAVKDPARNT